MEKSLLEQKLEQTLAELRMPLGERIYAEDLDRDAEFQDLTSEITSEDFKLIIESGSLIEKLFYSIFAPLSEEQIDKALRAQIPLTRYSAIYNGLGFEYFGIKGDGHESSEGVRVYYNQNLGWQLRIESKRHHPLITDKFYRDFKNVRFYFGGFEGIKMEIINLAKKDDYQNCSNLKHILEQMETLDAKPFNEQIIDELMKYIRELKRAVE